MVAGHLGDELDLVVGEANQQVRVADDVVRVQVVAVVRHEQAHVGQQPGRLQPLLAPFAETVPGAGGLEQLEGQPGGVLGVAALPGADRREVQHALAPEVLELSGRAPLPSPQHVEQHPFPKGVVRDGHLPDAQLDEGLLEDDGAAEDDVGPLGVESGQLEPVGHGGRLGQGVHHRVQLLGREGEAAHRPEGVAAPQRVDHLGQVGDGARAADRHLEAQVAGAPHGVGEVRPYVAPALGHGLLAQRLAAEEPLGEPDGAQLEAQRLEHLRALADDELGAATADVDEQVAAVEAGDGPQHPDVDQAGLLGAGHHLDLDAGLGPRPAQELVPVVRLAHGAGGHGVQRRSCALGDLAEPLQGGHAALDGFGFKPLHVT